MGFRLAEFSLRITKSCVAENFIFKCPPLLITIGPRVRNVDHDRPCRLCNKQVRLNYSSELSDTRWRLRYSATLIQVGGAATLTGKISPVARQSSASA